MADESAGELGGREGRLTVARTARYWTFGGGERGEAGAWRELWLVLHGYAQLARAFGAACAGLASDERLVVAPEGLSRFYREGWSGPVGASWMTREARADEIADALGWLDALHAHLVRGRGAVPTHVLGFSQGAAAAARWAALGSVSVERLVVWGAGLPPDLDPERARSRLAEMEVVWVAGERDPALQGARREEERARVVGLAPHARVEPFAGGHHLSRELLLRLAGT